MKYRNAKALLPDALVRELQRYIQGGYLYVPTEQEQKKRWGEASGYRQELQWRNRQIKRAVPAGVFCRFSGRKNTACLYMPSEKSFITNHNQQRLP